MINILLFKFLEKIHLASCDFKCLKKSSLKKYFKNNQFYNLERFCLINHLITIDYNEYSLTMEGITLFNFLKIYIKVYK